LPSRRTLVLCFLLVVLILGWLSWRDLPSRRQLTETAVPIIFKQPVNFAKRTFDPANPPPDMPPLTSGENAECVADFLSNANVSGQTRRTDATHGTMTWTGIGNVEGTLYRASPNARPTREALLLRGGVVGYSLPKPRTATLPVSPGDTLIFTTDGIGNGFRRDSTPDGPVQALADDILLRYGRSLDDALVLVARYVGVP